MGRSVEVAARGLRRLIAIARDAELGFRSAAHLARSTELGALLTDVGMRHKSHGEVLRRYVRLSVAAIQYNPGTPRGKGARDWMGLRARFNMERDRVLLQELLRLETRTVDEYERMLAGARLPEAIEKLVHQQLEECRRAAAWLRKAERAPERTVQVAKRRAARPPLPDLEAAPSPHVP